MPSDGRIIGDRMDCEERMNRHAHVNTTNRSGAIRTAAIAIYCSILVAPSVLRAQDKRPASEEELRKTEQVMLEEAKRIGPWEHQLPIIEDATDNIFRQQGWDAPEDAWARQVMTEVSRIPPWQPVERQEAFLNSVQSRWNLSHDQRSQLNSSVQRESMTLAFKHFKDIAPVAMEVMRTRANGEPFTPEQVQQWAAKLRPVMDDGAQMVQRVTQQLERTMTEEQRKLLQADVGAFMRRNNDMQRMVQKWQAGKWDPTDWGLQNDPVHAPVMHQYAARDAERNALVDRAQANKPLDEKRIAVNESEWDRYVKWFCDTYDCDDMQRTQAEAILKNSKSEAINLRSARRAEIEKLEKLVASPTNPQTKASHQADLDRYLAPINEVFERMKKRLHEEVLTTQQRARFTPPVAQKTEKP